MIDDLKYIHEKDAQDALGIASKQPEQLLYDFEIKPIEKSFSNIVYAGMGGSSLAALLSSVWPGYKVPFEIIRNYSIPAYVDAKTLFIACSYSGNTEETLSALAEAEKTEATIVIIAGGGKLQEIAEAKNLPFILLPKASQPRYAVFYNLKAIIQLLNKSGLLIDSTSEKELASTAAYLENHVKNFLPEVPTSKNPAKQLAKELMGKSVVVYAGQYLAPAAYKWKISFNENAKNVAWMGLLPEFNHNEFIGWSSHPTHKPYAVVELHSSFENPRILKRFEISRKLLSGKRPESHVVDAVGQTHLEQLLWTVMLGDFTSIYLGLLNGINPSPVELVEKFKKEMAN